MVASRNGPPAARGARQPGAAAGSTAELDIVALGARGDGIGRLGRRTVYVPLAAPGDRLRVRLVEPRGDGWAAAVLAVLEASPQRQAPPCPHFGDCGGCAAQHVAPPAYAAWKRALVEGALANRGIRDAAVLDAVRVPARSRRRVTLAALHHGGAVRVGFSARASHRIVDVHDCLVAAPGITALLGPLRAALASVLEPGERAEVMATLADTGADVLLVGRRAPDRAGREALAALAAEQDLARLSWSPRGGEPEPVAWRRAAVVSFAGVPVEPPPGAFLQPTAAGEAALVDAVTAALAGRKRIADLYAGCGPFTFALARAGAAVHAVESERGCVAALRRAAGRAGLAGRISAEVRDLERNPLTPEELARFDAVLFDPPRAGAREQVAALARSALDMVVAVSCNPATFARDARTLIDAGFRMGPVRPVDQFVWSAHVELVATFRR